MLSASVERLVALLEENNWDHRLVGEAVDGFNYVTNQALSTPFYYMGDKCFIGSDNEIKDLNRQKIRRISLFIHKQNRDTLDLGAFKAEVIAYLSLYKKGGKLRTFSRKISDSREKRHAVMKRGPFLMRPNGLVIPWTKKNHHIRRVG